jgi:hypothetical protein
MFSEYRCLGQALPVTEGASFYLLYHDLNLKLWSESNPLEEATA